MNNSELINVFRSRTGVVHRRMGNSFNALPCNSRNGGIKGTPGTMTCEQIAQSKRCEKCFPVVKVAA